MCTYYGSLLKIYVITQLKKMRINNLVYITTLIVDIKAVEKSIINLGNTGGIR